MERIIMNERMLIFGMMIGIAIPVCAAIYTYPKYPRYPWFYQYHPNIFFRYRY